MELIFNQKDNILEINNLQKSKLLFEINHYADKVEYSLIDFIDKNKLEFPNELKDIITKSSIEIFKNFNINNSKDKLLDKFIKEIYSLQNKINSTKVNFIRCLKPNDEMIPLKINHHRLTQQLKYNGVIEAIRVARQGYPIRIKNEIFYKLYHFVPINFNLIQGKNLTFLNKEQELYLEKMRYQILNQKAILIQSLFKSFIVRKKFINFKNNFIKLQANIKSKIQRNKFIKLLQNYKAIKIQKIIRGFISKNKFQKIKFIVLWWKFKFIWNKILYNKKIKASKTIIKFFKHLSFLSKIKKLSKIYQKIIGFILIIKAKQILKNLKIQAKDIQNIIEEKNKLLILLNIKHQQELNDKLLKDKLFKEKELESEAKERLLMEKEELIIMEIKREEDNKRLVDAIAEKDLRFIEEISKMNQELEEMRKLLEKSKNENKNKIGGDSCNVM
jgi:myosin heavy subunit